MTVLCDIPFGVLADGWEELFGLLVLFGVYVVGAIIKFFNKRAAGGEETGNTESSYLVELAKKRTQQRQARQSRLEQRRGQQQGSLSEWDRAQAMKRQRAAQLRDRVKKPPKQPALPPAAYQQPKPAPEPPVQRTKPPAIPTYQEVWAALQGKQPQRRQPQPHRVSRPGQKPVPQPVKAAAKPAKPSKRLPAVAAPVATARPLERILDNPNELRSAIILKEILDKPVALREGFGSMPL